MLDELMEDDGGITLKYSRGFLRPWGRPQIRQADDITEMARKP